MIDLNAATLWDLVTRGKSRSRVNQPEQAAPPPTRRVRPKPAPTAIPSPVSKVSLDDLPARMADRYELMTRSMLKAHGIRVRKWRTNMSGVAWQLTYKDGTVSRLIESPRPKGPVSASIFLHEIGHHAIGFYTYKPRCLEEYHAWMYSLEQMAAWGLNISQPVHNRVHDSLHYAVAKAVRRGLKRLPAELEPYVRPRAR